ncbi:MAG: UDP-N-acetylmuramate dehydrogenase, partial [Deltaproteobacteria bacterium]|nr:UDP-N-acetylmuramate dehydrogenase [Nannocystaceae bacterium]
MTTSIVRDVPLAGLTSLELGGAARWFAEPADEAALLEALAWADAHGIATVVIGGGSNLVVADAGVDALVIRYVARGVAIDRDGARVIVRAAAGEPWDGLVARCVADDLGGLECLSGIPGAVGATPIQNVGAYGSEVADTLARVRVLDRADGSIAWWTPERCELGYRTSAFKRAPNRHVVLAVEYALTAGAIAPARYAELAHALARVSTPSLHDVREAVLGLRRGKSMVIDPNDPNRRSVGSFFTNPIVAPRQADDVAARARAMLGADIELPRWPTADGRVKLAAAWLIERSGI